MTPHALTLLGTLVCAVGELGAAWLGFDAVCAKDVLATIVYGVAFVVLVLADLTLFPIWPRRSTARDERRHLDAAARFGSPRLH